jgi:SAM-dependent methyltransferase
MTEALAHAPGVELLDDPAADPERVLRSLGNVARANFWFGGTWAALYGLAQVTRGRTGAVSLLDIGTGLGDIPRAAVRWGARRGLAISPVGLERIPAAARGARRIIPTILGCAGSLPIRPHSVDVILLSQVLHHLDRASAVALLQDAHRAARLGVVVADLRRSGLAAALFHVGARALRFDPDTIRDGIVSIGRGYTREELAALCGEAGVPATVARRPGFRLVAWWRA